MKMNMVIQASLLHVVLMTSNFAFEKKNKASRDFECNQKLKRKLFLSHWQWPLELWQRPRISGLDLHLNIRPIVALDFKCTKSSKFFKSCNITLPKNHQNLCVGVTFNTKCMKIHEKFRMVKEKYLKLQCWSKVS